MGLCIEISTKLGFLTYENGGWDKWILTKGCPTYRSGNILRFSFITAQGRHLLPITSQCLLCRGRLVSPLVLTHGGVSPMPLLPQESTYISSAKSASCLSLETYPHSVPTSFKSYSISLIQQMSFIVN